MMEDAIVKLSAKKLLEKISINDIISEAKVGRQTFYNHYRDKADLISKVYEKQAMYSFSLLENGFRASIIEAQQALLEKRFFFAQACKLIGPNSLREYMYDSCVQLYRSYIMEHYGSSALTDEVCFAIEFYAYGVVHMLIRQCIKGLPISIERKASLVLDCMPEILKNFIPF